MKAFFIRSLPLAASFACVFQSGPRTCPDRFYQQLCLLTPMAFSLGLRFALEWLRIGQHAVPERGSRRPPVLPLQRVITSRPRIAKPALAIRAHRCEPSSPPPRHPQPIPPQPSGIAQASVLRRARHWHPNVEPSAFCASPPFLSWSSPPPALVHAAVYGDSSALIPTSPLPITEGRLPCFCLPCLAK